MADKRVILSLALATLIGFPLIGMGIIRMFSDWDIQIMLRGSSPVINQLAIGLVVGALMGFMAHGLTQTKLLKPSTVKYTRMLNSFRLNVVEKIVISVCAGFGEELLFRGAIQPYMGIIVTAVFFVAIHGYLNFRDWRITIYGIVMSIFMCGLGWMTKCYGIWSAVMAHTMIDIVLLLMMSKQGPHVPLSPIENKPILPT